MRPGELINVTGKVRVAFWGKEVRGTVDYVPEKGRHYLMIFVGDEDAKKAASREDIVKVLNLEGYVLLEQLSDEEIERLDKKGVRLADMDAFENDRRPKSRCKPVSTKQKGKAHEKSSDAGKAVGKRPKHEGRSPRAAR